MAMLRFLDAAVEYWAQRFPDHVAVRSNGASFSYARMADDVTALSEGLRSIGIGKGQRVGLSAAKSYEAIVAVLAVLRSGAAYVPLDPAAPTARNAAVMHDCGIDCVLADKARVRRFAGTKVHSLYDLSRQDWVRSGTHAQMAVAQERVPDDLAYILYTSGSTGTPKGIAHSHLSGLSYAQMAANLCELTSDDAVSHHTPLHFDMSIFDIFSSLIAGSTIVVVSEMHAKMPASLSELVQQEKISVWYSVPHVLIQMNTRGALDQRDMSSLRVVMFAGEKIPVAQLQAFALHAPSALYINAYGPTETNACVSCKMTAAEIAQLDEVPIGQADVGVTAVIEPTIPGSDEGELHIAGAQVMLGYWHDLAVGRSSFVPKLCADGQMRKFYATGDIVRHSGTRLVCVGRRDRQVKLRGFRVELDEVEAVLASIPGIIEAAVIVQGDSQTLRAFVAVAGDTNLDAQWVSEQSAAQLPPYAVPQQITLCPALIRTSTGKVNRAAMAELDNE